MTSFWPRPLADVGLRFLPRERWAAVKAAMIAVVGVTLFIVALDQVMPPTPDYRAFYASPLLPRTPLTSVRAVLEEVEFRLVLMSGLLLLTSAWRGRLSAAWVCSAILLSQFANVAPFVIADPLYATLRYWLPGCVWGWLYWRHGWLMAAAAHAAVHPLLDPVLLLSLSR